MSIIYRPKGGQWRLLKKVDYADERHLQQMLYDSPELIPVRRNREVGRVFIREAGLPGSGSTDLLGVDTDANIYIVECKLATNREIRRQVTGQVLEYAAYIWEMSYDDFDGLFLAREHRSLEELISAKAGEGWDFEGFRSRVVETLSQGSFELLIVVDEINEELGEIIAYLQDQLSRATLRAVALRLHGDAEIEILAPQVFGETLEEQTKPAGRKQTLEQVFERCRTSSDRTLLKLLVDEWKRLGNRAEPQTSGISFRAQIAERMEPIFWAPTPEFVNARFSGLISQGVPREIVEEYKNKVSTLGGFERAKVLSQSSPRAPLASLNQDDVRAITKVNQELVEKWRKSLP